MDAMKFTIEDIGFMAEGLDNLWGAVPATIIERLREVCADPKKYWDRDNGIILRFHGEGFDMGLTLWQAWLATDASAPNIGPATVINKTTGRSTRGKWSRYPTEANLLKAIQYAVFLPYGSHRKVGGRV